MRDASRSKKDQGGRAGSATGWVPGRHPGLSTAYPPCQFSGHRRGGDRRGRGIGGNSLLFLCPAPAPFQPGADESHRGSRRHRALVGRRHELESGGHHRGNRRRQDLSARRRKAAPVLLSTGSVRDPPSHHRWRVYRAVLQHLIEPVPAACSRIDCETRARRSCVELAVRPCHAGGAADHQGPSRGRPENSAASIVRRQRCCSSAPAAGSRR